MSYMVHKDPLEVQSGLVPEVASRIVAERSCDRHSHFEERDDLHRLLHCHHVPGFSLAIVR